MGRHPKFERSLPETHERRAGHFFAVTTLTKWQEMVPFISFAAEPWSSSAENRAPTRHREAQRSTRSVPRSASPVRRCRGRGCTGCASSRCCRCSLPHNSPRKFSAQEGACFASSFTKVEEEFTAAVASTPCKADMLTQFKPIEAVGVFLAIDTLRSIEYAGRRCGTCRIHFDRTSSHLWRRL